MASPVVCGKSLEIPSVWGRQSLSMDTRAALQEGDMELDAW